MIIDGRKLVNLFFISLILIIVVFIISNGSTDIEISYELILLLIILTIVVLVFIMIYIFSKFYRGNPATKKSEDIEDKIKNEDISNFRLIADFEAILWSIKNEFNPEFVTTEIEAERQLMNFLNTRFPSHAKSRGHTSRGKPIDIVIDGTYAVELIVVDNEGKLVLLMDHVLKFKEEFGIVVVILLDTHEVPVVKIEKYVTEFKKIGVKTIVKKVSYLK